MKRKVCKFFVLKNEISVEHFLQNYSLQVVGPLTRTNMEAWTIRNMDYDDIDYDEGYSIRIFGPRS